jgi:hypothetical protein
MQHQSLNPILISNCIQHKSITKSAYPKLFETFMFESFDHKNEYSALRNMLQLIAERE